MRATDTSRRISFSTHPPTASLQHSILALLTTLTPLIPHFLSFSPASFAPLEAALRLVYSFSECGPQFNTLVNEGTFPSLITAIHQTDIASHPHAQVVIAYYEICVRYIRHADSASIRRFVAAMVDSRGLRHSCKQVRCRTAYFLFKTAEAMEGKASTLLSIVGSFAGKAWQLLSPHLMATHTITFIITSVDRTLLRRGTLRGKSNDIGTIKRRTYYSVHHPTTVLQCSSILSGAAQGKMPCVASLLAHMDWT